MSPQEAAPEALADMLADRLEWALKLLKSPVLYMGKPEELDTFEKALQQHAEFRRSHAPTAPGSAGEADEHTIEALEWAIAEAQNLLTTTNNITSAADEQWYCTHCGAANDDELASCDSCGEPRP